MYLLIISSQPVTALFGKNLPFTGINCNVKEDCRPADLQTADCVIDLTIEDHPQRIAIYQTSGIPVLIGSVVYTLSELNIASNSPIARFNHWPTFINRNCIEFAVEEQHTELFLSLFNQFDTPAFKTADEPGFVGARTVSMIINEAFLAKQEAVSTEVEIDTAMKLGTGYRMGPFEWCSQIGSSRILQLLQKLAEKDNRYQPASSFTQLTTQD